MIDCYPADLSENDYIFISHYHDAGDGFVNLEEASEWIEDDLASLSSVVHRSAVPQSFLLASRPHHFTQEVTSPKFEKWLLDLNVPYRISER